MPKCEQCGKEILFPFECNYCGKTLCEEHRLPENHQCPNLPHRSVFSPTTEGDSSTRVNEPKPRTHNIRKAILALAIVIPITLLGLIFIPRLFVPSSNSHLNQTSQTLLTATYVDAFPFQDDFHLSKNILSQGGIVRYRFNVTHTFRVIDITVTSTDRINLRLICDQNNSVVLKQNWTIFVFVSPLLEKGTWTVEIETFYSGAEGIISINYGFTSWYDFVHRSVERQDSTLVMKYTDDMKETISVNITITTRSGYDYVTVWTYVNNGTDRNDFTQTWACENKNYFVYFTVSHELFGELKWTSVLIAPL